MIQIGMVAGEPSGDLLAGRIIQGIRDVQPQIQVSGIGGPQMQQVGLDTWYPMDVLSVFGYVDALKRLPKILQTYYGSLGRWKKTQPDVFVGIDAPDFNLRMEMQLRKQGIPTVQFVGPSIWAWRYERIHKIRQAVSHMLVLFPFEVEIYEKEGIPVTCVGHPLAQNIPLDPDKNEARRRLGLAADAKVLALLPGSRRAEIALLAPRFLQAVQKLQQDHPDLQVVVPMVNAQRETEFNAILQQYPIRHLRLLRQSDQLEQSRPAAWDAMQAADGLLVASGTATLEAMLFKRPMVISYVLSPLMQKLMAWQSGQSKPLTPWIGLPNILAQDFVVPELLQEDATPDKLAKATERALFDLSWADEVTQRFMEIHLQLRLDTPRIAAEKILELAHAR
ncbi:lipid-A-disaccharide synthase [uncultured Paenalcaligenes sp.]|uniref:lipid-A-disaccharide synthase n=1 Tax=uncultured Paenalcaligenes sp. TaxID=1588925 RepID=UPI002616D0AB|nr:lipid-A-disaccharide synthase [uncultured Paenalcaligenes sp.]